MKYLIVDNAKNIDIDDQIDFEFAEFILKKLKKNEKKILISLCENPYIRNYLSTSAFSLIKEKYDFFIADDKFLNNKTKD